MRCLLIQHDHVSPPGAVGERLAQRGVDIHFHEVVPEARHYTPDVTTTFPDVEEFDLVVAMGAPWSVYDEERIGSWVQPELELLRAADRDAIPVLGICFGGQLLAAAHGGSVCRAEETELGWKAIRTDDPALVPPGPWFQWHQDRWELPPGAIEFARTDIASQAYVLRHNLAVQFHPELNAAMLQLWLDNGGEAMVRGLGRDSAELLAETRQREAESRVSAAVLVDTFLDRVVAGHWVPQA